MSNFIYYSHEDYLMHYGVQGMKWGVRKAVQSAGTRIKGLGSNIHVKRVNGSPSSGQTKTRKPSKISSFSSRLAEKIKAKRAEKKRIKEEAEEAAKKQKERDKPVSEMSDKELSDRLNRLRNEEQYNQLKAKLYPEKKKSNPVADFGKSFVKNSLQPAIEQSFKSIATDVMTKQGKTMIENYLKTPADREKEAFDKKLKRAQDVSNLRKNEVAILNNEKYLRSQGVKVDDHFGKVRVKKKPKKPKDAPSITAKVYKNPEDQNGTSAPKPKKKKKSN